MSWVCRIPSCPIADLPQAAPAGKSEQVWDRHYLDKHCTPARTTAAPRRLASAAA